MTQLKSPAVLAGGIVALAIVVFLAFGVFGVQTLFIDDKVDEAGPVFVSGAAPSGIASDDTPPAMAEDMTEAMKDEPVMVEADDPMPEMADTEDMPADETPPEIVAIHTGMFVDRSHETSGVAEVLNDGSAQRFLRFEDFETSNGPDLNVYLSAAPADAPAGDFDDDYVDLGDLKGNIGSQNYEVPEGVDLDRYSTVVIWCVRFSVAFGAAELS
jgi:Electron transfer DM13